MLNITTHQRNANQNQNEIITSHLSKWLSSKRPQITNAGKDVEKREPLYSVYGNVFKLVQLLWKTAWRFLKKLKIELSYNPAIPLLGVYRKKIKTVIWKDICTPTAALFTIALIQKQLWCSSTDEGIKKMWYIYTMEYYPLKKNEILPFATTQMVLFWGGGKILCLVK